MMSGQRTSTGIAGALAAAAAPLGRCVESALMPTYVYQVITDAGDGEVFEVRQPITDEPLKRHPETGQPVRRLLTTPTVVSRSPDEAGKALASDKRLDQLGFTKYVKTSEGKYEKRAGQGPKTLRRDDV